MLEAKRVTPDGYAFSLATEFIENLDPAATKQDCELKAFARLAETLKRHFPQLPLLLLGDALYANQTVFAICRANDWRFIFTFKAGSLPALFADYETLRDLEPQNRVERREKLLLFASGGPCPQAAPGDLSAFRRHCCPLNPPADGPAPVDPGPGNPTHVSSWRGPVASKKNLIPQP